MRGVEVVVVVVEVAEEREGRVEVEEVSVVVGARTGGFMAVDGVAVAVAVAVAVDAAAVAAADLGTAFTGRGCDIGVSYRIYLTISTQ